MNDDKDLLSSLVLELRRGTLILCVLSQLKTSQYGYALVQRLESRGTVIDPSTLYPLLRRLEKQGLLISQWDTKETKPRKYYRRTPEGDLIYEQMKEQWQQMAADMTNLLEESDE